MDSRIGSAGLLLSEGLFISEALDSADSVRLSKFERFELLMNPEKRGSAVSLAQARASDFQISAQAIA
jgi:hypothetical protein